MVGARVWGAVVAVLCVAVACSPDRSEPEGATEPAERLPAVSIPVEPAQGAPLSAPVENVTHEAGLDALYRECLLERGFDPQGVQVLVDDAGVPWWIKTGHNVPSGLHSDCFEVIGGAPTSATSHGTPLDESASVGWVNGAGVAQDETSELGLATYSWASHIEALGPPRLGSPTGGVGVEDDLRAPHRIVEGIIGFDVECGVTLSGRFTFVNTVWDAERVRLEPSKHPIAYSGNPDDSLEEPIRLAQGDWIVAEVLRVLDPAIHNLAQNEDTASMEFVSAKPNARCTSPDWVVILDLLQHIPQAEWNPPSD